MQEEDCTSEKVLRFVEAEELGRSSVLDIRPAGEAQQISGYMRSKMTGLPPPNPTPGKKCWRCKQNHSPETRCPQWKDKYHCDMCNTTGHSTSRCDGRNRIHCDFCKKKGHTSARCRLRSSDNDKQVKVGNHNLIEAEAVNEATMMNIGQRSHTSPTLAPKRGGPGG